jgi:hypothetical protein
LSAVEAFLPLMPDGVAFVDIGCSMAWHTELVAQKALKT